MTSDTDERIEVAVLGTYHMDDPGLDVVNVDADDVLADGRQRELEALADRLAGWDPDAVAVERPNDRQDDLDTLYEQYRSGERAYDEEWEIDPPHALREDPTGECRSEVIQVGFRLADRLDHGRVHAVDYTQPMVEEGNDLGEGEFETAAGRAIEELAVPLPDPAEMQRRADEHLAESTILEHLRWTNRDRQLRQNHDLMFAGSLTGFEEQYRGVPVLTRWYDRNLRIVENLWRAAGADTDRILLVIGAGHVRVLRNLLEETPTFEPVSALPLLAG